MITKKKIDIYIKYDGNIDEWASLASKSENLEITDSDWYILDSLIEDISLVEKGITSDEFERNLNMRISKECDNKETINKLYETSSKFK